MNLKKLIAVMVCVLILVTSLAGCGEKKNESKEAEPKKTVQDTPKDEAETPAKEIDKTITMYASAAIAETEGFIAFNKAFEEDTGFKVEVNVIPGSGPEQYAKIDISLMAGEQVDIIRLDNSNVQYKYGSSGLLYPLNDLIKSNNYEAEQIHGEYLDWYDGNLYYLPTEVSLSCVLYNKQIFDDANVPYPDGSWTWDEYIETAKKLNNPSKRIYGSLMQTWEYYLYTLARQQKVSGYKADGTSNYDDPAFANSLRWFGELSSVHEIQPSWLEMKASNIGWDSFMSGTYGMTFIGGWHLGIMNSPDYQKDWKWGITAPPTNPEGNNNFGSVQALAINKNAKNPEGAFEYVAYAAKEQYKYRKITPARIDVSKEDLEVVFGDVADKSDGSVTVENIYKAFVDNGLGFTSEKIVGVAASEYNSIILKEGELYLVGEQSLEDTIAKIKQQADLAIVNADQ